MDKISDEQSAWTAEQHINHVASLAMGFGATGRPDLKASYTAARERAIAALSALEPPQEEPVAIGYVSQSTIEGLLKNKNWGGIWSSSITAKAEPYAERSTIPLYAHPTTQQPAAITDEMVERACISFIDHWQQCTDEVKEDCRQDMRAALTAALL